MIIMKCNKFNFVLSAVSMAAVLGFTSSAYASTSIPAPTYCSTATLAANAAGISREDVTYNGNNASGCYGVVAGNINSAAGINALNLSWGNDWTYLDGSDSGSATYQGIKFTVTATAGNEGTWKLTALDTNGTAPLNLPATFDLAVALKASDRYALWFYNDASVKTTNGGQWEIEFKNNGGNHPDLSHIMVFGRDGRDTSTVPVPAAAWLLGSGLLGIVGISRRKVKAA